MSVLIDSRPTCSRTSRACSCPARIGLCCHGHAWTQGPEPNQPPLCSRRSGTGQSVLANRVEAMQKPPHASPRESTEAMVRNIGRELPEIEQALHPRHADPCAD
jgi:hypothetical protein